MQRSARPSGPSGTGRRSTLVAILLVGALGIAGCVSVTTNPTPRTDATPFGATPPPTREPAATPEDEEITPEPEATPRPTRRPRATEEATPKPTPKPTKKPKPTPTDASDPTDEPTEPPTPAPTSWPEGAHTTKQAKDHVGETGTVCGIVVAAQYLPDRPGRPTFLNIDKPYPNQRFNVVIWGEQRRAFPLDAKPEVAMLGKEICVTGEISAYVDWTQIAYADKDGTDVLP
jgi:outer membrane biosynthesis protein TonB